MPWLAIPCLSTDPQTWFLLAAVTLAGGLPDCTFSCALQNRLKIGPGAKALCSVTIGTVGGAQASTRVYGK